MWWEMFCPCYETLQTSLKLLRNKRQEEKERTVSPDNEVLPLCFICKTAWFEKSGSHFIGTEPKCSAWNSPKWINSLPIIFKWRKINRIGAWGRIINCRVYVCVSVCVYVWTCVCAHRRLKLWVIEYKWKSTNPQQMCPSMWESKKTRRAHVSLHLAGQLGEL